MQPDSFPFRISLVKLSLISFLTSLVPALAASVPLSYNLRLAGPASGGSAYTSWVSDIQNQSNQGDCWAFATATAINSNMLMRGLLSTSATPPPIQVSPWTISANNGQAQWYEYTGKNSNSVNSGYNDPSGNYGWGGFESQAMACLTRGTGAWKIYGGLDGQTTSQAGGGINLISADKKNAFPLRAVIREQSMEPHIPRPAQLNSFLPSTITFLDQDQNNRTLTEQIAAVKKAILENGAVTTGMNAESNYFDADFRDGNPFYNKETGWLNFYSEGADSTDHEVTIIGWDDDIDLVVGGRHFKGGWLVQNSWGDWAWEGHGLFWASYEDQYIGRDGVSSYEVTPLRIAEDAVANAGVLRSSIVLQNQIGPAGVEYGYDGYGWDQLAYVINSNGDQDSQERAYSHSDGTNNEAASILKSDRPFRLVSVGLFSAQYVSAPFGNPFTAEITLYRDWADGPTGQLAPTQTVTFDGPQYMMFDLDSELPLLESIVIVVNYRNLLSYDQGSYAIPFESYSPGMPDPESGLSFYYNYRDNVWVDLASGEANGVFFVKGITAAFPTLSWDGAATGGHWNDGTNWQDLEGTAQPWSNENDVNFIGLAATATITLNQDVAIGDLIYAGADGDTLTITPETDEKMTLRYLNTTFFVNTGTTLRIDSVLEDWESHERNLILAGGKTVLTAENTYSGYTQINVASKLELAGDHGKVAGDIHNYGELILNHTADFTLDVKVEGVGSVTQKSTHTVKVEKDQTYSGQTIVEKGTLKLTKGTLSDRTAVIVGADGTFVVEGETGVEKDFQAGSIAGEGSFIIDRKLTVGTNHRSTEVSGIISGNGTLIKDGDGTLKLSGANTFTGAIEIDGGILEGASASAFGAASKVVLGSGGTLINGLAGGESLLVPHDLHLEGGQITLNELSATTAAFTIGGTLFTSGANTLFLTDLTSSGVFSIFQGGGTTAALDQFKFVFGDTDTDLSGVSLSYSGGQIVMTVQSDAAITGNKINVKSDFITFIPKSSEVVVVPGSVIGALQFNNDSTLVGGKLTVARGIVDTGFNVATFANSEIEMPNGMTKLGAGALFIENTVTVGGDANVQEGLLKVEGILTAQNLNVASQGALGGSGLIFGNVFNNGLLAPGSSPGTMTINGNLTLGSGSTVQLEIESLSVFDRILVSGSAVLDGTLDVIPFGGNELEYGQQFLFLTASSVSGEFDVINMPADFRGRILIDGGNVTLLAAPSSYTLLAENQNQENVAAALDGFIPATSGDRETISITLDLMSAAQYPAAFDAIAPSFYESLGDITIEQTSSQNQLIAQRLSAVRLGSRGFSAIGLEAPLVNDKNGRSVMDAKDGKNILSPAQDNNWGVWVQGNGLLAKVTNVSQMPNYRFDSGGFLVGADYRWSENFSTGVYGGYQGTYADYDNGSNTRINSALFGGYATYDNEGFYIDAIVGGGYSNYTVKRSIEFSTINRVARSQPGGGQFTTYLDAGYDWRAGGFTFGPIVSGQYTYAGIAPFTEDGAESLDLRVSQQNANSIRTNLGGRVAYTWNVTDTITFIPEVRLFWQHEFLNNPRNIAASLDGGSGPGFGYTTSAPARDSVFAGAGIVAQFGERWNGYVYYNTDFGRQDYLSHIVSAGLAFKF